MILPRATTGSLAAAVALVALAACGPSDAELRRTVTTYTQRLIEAYRTSDPRPIEPITGEEEGRKLTALIGVKRDGGVTLDAELLELRFGPIVRRGDEFLVTTEERWYYQDRRIGTGERVGDDSTDRYWLQYRLKRSGAGLVVQAVDLTRPPEIGRKPAPASVEVMHGVDTHPPTALPSDAGGRPVPPGAAPHAPGGERR